MVIKEFIEKIDTFNEEERLELFPLIFAKLCPVSKIQITTFQHTWDGTRPYKEFEKAMNNEVVHCLKMEMSKIGAAVRDAQDLSLLDENTIL